MSIYAREISENFVKLYEAARRNTTSIPFSLNTPSINTLWCTCFCRCNEGKEDVERYTAGVHSFTHILRSFPREEDIKVQKYSR